MTGMTVMKNVQSFVCMYVQIHDSALEVCDVHLFSFSSPKTSAIVSSILMGLVLLGRAAFVFPLSFLSNLTKKNPEEKIGFKQQV